MKTIILEGGKGGGGSSFSEQDNTLRSNTYVSTLEGLGYGAQLGPVNGLRSVYLDDTPLYDADNKPNFNDIIVEFRTGLPSQAAITGFEEIGAPVTVATDVTVAAPVTRTTSSATVSAVGVTIRLPSGLYNQNTADNKLEATTLEFVIKHKLTSSGTWLSAFTKKYNDKTTSAYEETFRVNRPAGTGTWDVRVERVTADSAASTLRNAMQFAYLTEYDTETITYPNVALMGITLNASGVNSTKIPVRSVDWYGRIIKVPNNFNSKTRIYTGIWNLSTFQNSWCNDPAWVLYDLATDPVVGLGLTIAQVDLASFYEASIYNSERVPFTGIDGLDYAGPRFSFNAPISEGASAIDTLKRVASVMNATLLWVNGQLTLVQDRPDTFRHVFTNANVLGGRFTRSGTPDDTRYTVCNVTWNAPADGYKQRVTSVENAAGITAYGYLETNVAAFGCTSLAQAVRYGKWILDTSLNTTGTITFTTGEIGAAVIPGDVIRVYDNTYAGYDAAGRLLDGNTTTVLKLDRPVLLTAGSKITLWNNDGTVITDAAVTTTGTVSTITLTAALAAAPTEGAIYQITTNGISPELYRVSDREEVEDGKFQITANQYDPDKWARIEGGIVHTIPRYSGMDQAVVSAPTGLTFTERNIYVDLGIQRKLNITWTPVFGQVVSAYRVTYTINGGNKTVVDVKMPGIEIDVTTGIVLVTVQALSFKGYPSASLDGSYTVAATETTGSVLNPPTNLVVYGAGGTTFTTRDLIVQWTNPTTNGATKDGVVRFKVEVYNGAVLLRSEYVAPVAPGATQTYTYSYDNNVADGGPRRAPTIKVYCQDASKKLSTAVTTAFTNAAPAAPSGLAVTGGVGNVFVTNTLPTDSDYKGTLVWASLTTGFTPAAGNIVYDGSDNLITVKQLGTGVHFVKVAHYDTFGKDFAGTGLNLSAQQTATPVSTGGIASGASNPGTGAEGDLFFNTTDGKLYRYHSGAWTAYVATLDLTGTIATTQITDSAITTPKIATNAITTNKLFVAGRGQEMNADPTCQDVTAWTGGQTPILATGITDIPTGGSTALTNNPNVQTQAISEFIPIDSSFNYRIETTVKQTTGTLGTCYLGVAWYDGAKTLLSSAPATGWPSTGTFSYFGLIGTAMPTTWTSYSIGFGPNETAKQHPSAKYVRLIAYLNFNNTASSICALARHALIRKTTGEVIVDGTLAAAKIVANSITTGQLQAAGVNGDRITANTLAADRIVANSLTTTQIQAGGIAADRIVANSLTTTQMQAGGINADRLAAGSITTDKMLVTGRGKALNDDPACMDMTAWTVVSGTAVVQTDTTAPVGTTSIRSTNATFIQSKQFPVEAGKTYKVTVYAKKTTAGGGMYLRLYAYAAAGGTQVSYLVTGLTPITTTIENITVPGTWTRYVGYVTPAATAVYAKASIHTNWNTTGTTDICDFRVEEYIGADLIVDGSISAAKIVTGSITADKLYITTGAVATASASGLTLPLADVGSGGGYASYYSPPSSYTQSGAAYAGIAVGSVVVPTNGCSLYGFVNTSFYVWPHSSWSGATQGQHMLINGWMLTVHKVISGYDITGSYVGSTVLDERLLQNLWIPSGSAPWAWAINMDVTCPNLTAGTYVMHLKPAGNFYYGQSTTTRLPCILNAGVSYYSGLSANTI